MQHKKVSPGKTVSPVCGWAKTVMGGLALGAAPVLVPQFPGLSHLPSWVAPYAFANEVSEWDPYSFHFENGNELIFEFSKQSADEVTVRFLDHSSETPVEKSKAVYSSVQVIHVHLQDLKPLPIGRRLPIPSGNQKKIKFAPLGSEKQTFTWFSTATKNFIAFQDGTIIEAMWEGPELPVSAQLISFRGEKYSIESYGISLRENNLGEKTWLRRIGKEGVLESESIEIDHQYHSEVSNPSQFYVTEQGILLSSLFRTSIDLKRMSKKWQFADNGVQFELEHLSADTPPLKKRGFTLTRLAHGTQKEKSIYLGTEKSEHFQDVYHSVKDGIFEIESAMKTLDLRAFDAEIRREESLGSPAVVRGRDGKVVDPIEELKNYTDLVVDSRKNPTRYLEIADARVIRELAEALRVRKSAVVLGKSGTGKTSTIKAFAREVGLGNVPGFPRTTQIFEISASHLGAGIGTVGTIEKRISALKAAAVQTGCIYFIDELHTLVGIGVAKGQPNDVTQYLKSSLGNGTLQIIATDTTDEFHNTFARDEAFYRRFKQVSFSEPRGNQLIEILRAKFLGKSHEPQVATVEKAVSLSGQYSVTPAQPAAAADLLENAWARMGTYNRFEDPIAPEVLQEVAIERYKIDPAQFTPKLMKQKLSELRKKMDDGIIGQSDAKDAMFRMWAKKIIGVGDTSQMKSLLLVGPPGVGKSEIAKVSAQAMGFKSKLVEMNKYSIGGIEDLRRELYMALMDSPFHVFILDEFEKAHPSVQEGLLSILQSGEFTVQERLGEGRFVSKDISAKHALFLMTSNAGQELINRLGSHEKPDQERLYQELEYSGISKPILSRISEVVSMKRPTRDEFRTAIQSNLMSTLERESKKHGVTFILKDAEGFIDWHASSHSESTDYRAAKRIVQEIENKIADAILAECDDPCDDLGDVDPACQPGKTVELEWKKAKEKKEHLSHYS